MERIARRSPVGPYWEYTHERTRLCAEWDGRQVVVAATQPTGAAAWVRVPVAHVSQLVRSLRVVLATGGKQQFGGLGGGCAISASSEHIDVWALTGWGPGDRLCLPRVMWQALADDLDEHLLAPRRALTATTTDASSLRARLWQRRGILPR